LHAVQEVGLRLDDMAKGEDDHAVHIRKVVGSSPSAPTSESRTQDILESGLYFDRMMAPKSIHYKNFPVTHLLLPAIALTGIYRI
jgi:hypothetical protein